MSLLALLFPNAKRNENILELCSNFSGLSKIPGVEVVFLASLGVPGMCLPPFEDIPESQMIALWYGQLFACGIALFLPSLFPDKDILD